MKNGKNIVRDPKTGRVRVFTHFDENVDPSMTDESMARDTDVNYIMEKYMKGEHVQFINEGRGHYIDLTEFPDFDKAMEIVGKAKSAFQLLPPQLREKFNQDPHQLVNYLQDPKNDAEAVELGLKEYKKPTEFEQTMDVLQKIATPTQTTTQTTTEGGD